MVSKRSVRFSKPYVTKDEIKEVTRVLKSGWWTSGKVARDFERDFGKYLKGGYPIAVNSGTAALHLALKTIGIGRGDEVIVPTMTFAATAEVVIHCGAKPVLCDCETDSLNIDIKDLERKISKKTKAVIPVHIAGLPCRTDEIRRLTRPRKLFIIEDACHALGAEYKGKRVGTLGDLAAFSFYVTKPISTGEGGMLVATRKDLSDVARSLSLHGLSKDAWSRYSRSGMPFYKITYAGFKYNMPDILAALGVWQLKKADFFLKRRELYAKMYTNGFRSEASVEIPVSPEGFKHAWHLYIIRLDLESLNITRNEFMARLIREGVQTSVHFMPLHMHPFYKKEFGFKEKDFPNAAGAFKKIVSLPIYPSMNVADVNFVIDKVKKVLAKAKR